jgi:hypothetical protein
LRLAWAWYLRSTALPKALLIDRTSLPVVANGAVLRNGATK